MPTIGGTAVDVWNDDGIFPASVELSPYQHPVLDGDGVVVGGKRSPYANVVTQTRYTTLALAYTAAALAIGIKNTFVTIDPTLNASRSITNTYVQDVKPEPPKACAGLGGAYTHLLIIRWQFRIRTDWAG